MWYSSTLRSSLSASSRRYCSKIITSRMKNVQVQRQALTVGISSSVDFQYGIIHLWLRPFHSLQPFGVTSKSSSILNLFSRKLSSDANLQKEVKDAMINFQDLFVEARLSIEDVQESLDTTYFEEDLDIAKDAVQVAIEAFDSVTELLKDDVDKLNEFKRANVMKVKQLQEELKMVSEHYLHE